jgi:hypothetical protein
MIPGCGAGGWPGTCGWAVELRIAVVVNSAIVIIKVAHRFIISPWVGANRNGRLQVRTFAAHENSSMGDAAEFPMVKTFKRFI